MWKLLMAKKLEILKNPRRILRFFKLLSVSKRKRKRAVMKILFGTRNNLCIEVKVAEIKFPPSREKKM